MKKYFLLYKILLICLPGVAQLTTSGGTNWIASGNVNLTIQNMDLVNNGHFVPGTGSVKFTGTQNSGISGNNAPRFYILEMAKTNGAKLFLNRSFPVNSSINFISGQLDLNGNNLLLATNANIAGESENNRIIGPSGGYVEITQDMNAPAAMNAGNLGATITSSANLGSVTIRRGHTSQSGVGLSPGINRYYSIVAANNASLNATLRLKYFDAEINGQNENSLVIYKSNDNGSNWSNMSQTTRNTNANYVEKTGMSNLTLQTLGNDNVVVQDGATGVVLIGQRKKATEVTLKWNSLSETNMSGYQVQRRLKNEADFSDRAFVNSSATGGNSTSQMSYQNIDDNPYTDTSFYRLKMLTLNGSFTYSNVIAVAGKTKGGGGNGNGNDATLTGEITTTSRKQATQINTTKKITVGPNPNNGNFWFSVNAIEKETIATLFTLDGKQVQQFRVVNRQQQKVSDIKTGIYLLKVPGFETQKIIVNSGGNNAPVGNQTTIDNSKL